MTDARPSRSHPRHGEPATEITGIHHVGWVVNDLSSALAGFRRLGFSVPPPSCPALPMDTAEQPRPLGVANTHADFPRSFIELASVFDTGDTVPDETVLVPLLAPAEQLPVVAKSIRRVSEGLRTYADRGLGILMLSSRDIDATARRLTTAGVRHGGVLTVRRMVDVRGSQTTEVIRYLEIEEAPAPGMPRARVGVVADLEHRIQSSRELDHDNGAVGIVDATFCVPVDHVEAAVEQVATYVGAPAEPHARRGIAAFDLGAATLTVATPTDVRELIPTEGSPTSPSIAGCTVAVHDLSTTDAALQRYGIPRQRTSGGELVVSLPHGHGASLIFREISQ